MKAGDTKLFRSLEDCKFCLQTQPDADVLKMSYLSLRFIQISKKLSFRIICTGRVKFTSNKLSLQLFICCSNFLCGSVGNTVNRIKMKFMCAFYSTHLSLSATFHTEISFVDLVTFLWKNASNKIVSPFSLSLIVNGHNMHTIKRNFHT